MTIICFFFFFQAEDGIRDYKVTGVQTCALPISLERGEPPETKAQRPFRNAVDRRVPPGRGGLRAERAALHPGHADQPRDASTSPRLDRRARRRRSPRLDRLTPRARGGGPPARGGPHASPRPSPPPPTRP